MEWVSYFMEAALPHPRGGIQAETTHNYTQVVQLTHVAIHHPSVFFCFSLIVYVYSI